MSRVEINGSDTTTLRLLHLDLPPEAVDRFTQMAGTGEWPLKSALGASKLRESLVDVVAIKDLGPMRLSQYLAQAHEVSARAMGKDAARIDALEGHVVILPPRAFDGTSQTLTISAPLALIGSYAELAPAGRGAPITARSAQGSSGGGAPAQPGKAGSTALKLILTAVALVLGGVLWVALR
ncbi:aspartate carbamoyltransferase catalytic subunit [Maliponia aquimaris]|uniref:Aspartate carbamoyltransferase catalytic subunit n=1 Tax=Maliponia aquimaris TaxID=1673631 RepID=A0A238K4E1_9RHOB|nr:aspartate carbamoyltransferase catalytic subunit [Maliponia aquimaris]SMX37739.1 hypothetical protein MAA8898_01246 [Maliponia aquimaris]